LEDCHRPDLSKKLNQRHLLALGVLGRLSIHNIKGIVDYICNFFRIIRKMKPDKTGNGSLTLPDEDAEFCQLRFQGRYSLATRLQPYGGSLATGMILPPTENTSIGLAQHSCSILMTNRKENGWLGGSYHLLHSIAELTMKGLVLVDLPTRTMYRSLEKDNTPVRTISRRI
jgi:hypothetical protein